jgi:type III secretion protein J
MRRNVHLLLPAAVLALSGCSVELQHDLAEDDANEIYVLLTNHGVNATKVKEEGDEPRYVISVPKPDVTYSATLLKDASLPRPRADGLAVFKKMKGMIPTQTEERAMFVEALGGEVSNTLNRIPGVLEAKAIVMIPENNDLAQPDKKPLPSASVLIKWTVEEKGKDTPPITAAEVREFTAMAVPELKKENVQVLFVQVKPTAETTTGDTTTRMQKVLGLRMEASSADTFKVMIIGAAVLVIVLTALSAFMFIRKPGGSKPAPKPKPAEG